METKKDKIKGMIKDYAFLIFACALGAFTTTAVMIPNGLTSGGLTGIVRIIQNYVNVEFSLLYYAGALIILGIVWFSIGLREAKKVLMVTLVYPAILFVFERFDFQLLEEKDIILAAIFCGIFSGICNGIVFWRGYSFCGTESIAKIIKKKFLPQMDISRILLCLDAVIIIISAFIYGRNIALYALITQFIASKMVDFIMYGFETKIVQLSIITSKPKEVADFVINNIGRGVSSRTIVGEYTNTIRKEMVVLCSPRESMLIKKYLIALDPSSFVTILHVETVWGLGKGFTDIEKDV
ncbi:MAG: YitT family protein [Eubacteriales bacterium]|nr:YitT family protein [Eubacteriales bacterium]